MNYIEKLKLSEERSNELGIGSRVPFDFSLMEEDVINYREASNTDLLRLLIRECGKGYWSNSCIPLAVHSFCYFKGKGIPCELVFGEVIINGCHEYDTTLEELVSEWERGYSMGVMNIHVWLNIGNNLIVDPAIASRISEHYCNTLEPYQVIVGEPAQLEEQLRLQYLPILSGAKFLERTNGIKFT